MATKKCILCNEEISEEFGKLKGTTIRVVEDKKKNFIYVCSACMQKDEKWLEKAKIKGV